MKRFNRTYNDIQACPLPPFSSLCTHNILSMRMRVKHSQSQRGKKRLEKKSENIMQKGDRKMATFIRDYNHFLSCI